MRKETLVTPYQLTPTSGRVKFASFFKRLGGMIFGIVTFSNIS